MSLFSKLFGDGKKDIERIREMKEELEKKKAMDNAREEAERMREIEEERKANAVEVNCSGDFKLNVKKLDEPETWRIADVSGYLFQEVTYTHIANISYDVVATYNGVDYNISQDIRLERYPDELDAYKLIFKILEADNMEEINKAIKNSIERELLSKLRNISAEEMKKCVESTEPFKINLSFEIDKREI